MPEPLGVPAEPVVIFEHAAGARSRVSSVILLVSVIAAMGFGISRPSVNGFTKLVLGGFSTLLLFALWSALQRFFVRIDVPRGTLFVERTRWPLSAVRTAFPLDDVLDSTLSTHRVPSTAIQGAYVYGVRLLLRDGKDAPILGGTEDECALTAAAIGAALKRVRARGA